MDKKTMKKKIVFWIVLGGIAYIISRILIPKYDSIVLDIRAWDYMMGLEGRIGHSFNSIVNDGLQKLKFLSVVIRIMQGIYIISGAMFLFRVFKYWINKE